MNSAKFSSIMFRCCGVSDLWIFHWACECHDAPAQRVSCQSRFTRMLPRKVGMVLWWCCGGVSANAMIWIFKKNLCQKFSHEYVGLAFCWLRIKVHSNLIMSTRQCDDQIHWRKSSKLPDSDSCFGHRLPHFITLSGHQALWDSWRLGGHGPWWRTSMSMWLLWNFG